MSENDSMLPNTEPAEGKPVPRVETPDNHWLTRPETIRKLWIALYVVLAITVLAQLGIKVKGYFGVDGWLGSLSFSSALPELELPLMRFFLLASHFSASLSMESCSLSVLVVSFPGRPKRGRPD